MVNQNSEINAKYTRFYAGRTHTRIYPTEFVVRALLADYPCLNFRRPKSGDTVLDVAFGDGRNTAFLCDLNLDVSGIEIASGIVQQTGTRLKEMHYYPDLRVGRNSNIPYEDSSFDYILACHCCYYCDEGETLIDNLKEYHRVLKPEGWLIASVADRNSYIFENAEELQDGSMRIMRDPYCNREGYRLHGFHSKSEVEDYFSAYFGNFSFGHASNDYFGIQERVFWVVCGKQ